MQFLKDYGMALLSLLIMLIVLTFLLKIGKKAPVIGGVVEKAEELSGLDA